MSKKSKPQSPNFLEIMDDVTDMMIGYRGFTKRRTQQ